MQKEKYSRVVNPFAIKEARREYCVNCGISATSVTYEVHHIVPKSRGGNDEPENLINLCSGPTPRERGGCHQQAHAKLISADHLREMTLMDIKQREGIEGCQK